MDKVFASTSSRRSDTCPMRTGIDGLVEIGTGDTANSDTTTMQPQTSSSSSVTMRMAILIAAALARL